MHIPGLLSLVAASALSSTPTAPKGTAAASPTEVALEVIERDGGKSSRFSFVVSTHGTIEAWLEEGDGARRCQVQVLPDRAGLQLDLECKGRGASTLRIETVRALVPGKRTRIAQVNRPGGSKSEVFATLR
ncbi:MAG: hypothetical protein AB1Z98_32730 [Nannocystaceae bacterium]